MESWLDESKITTLPQALLRAVDYNPDRVAIDYFGKTITYRELAMTVIQYSKLFSFFGEVHQEDRVALLLPNIPQFIFGYYGSLLSGAITVPINFSSIAKELKTKPVKEIKITEEIIAQIADSRPKVLMIADFFWPIISQIEKQLKDTMIIVAGPEEYLPLPINKLYWIKAMKEGKYVHVPRNNNIFSLKEIIRNEFRMPMGFRYPELKINNVAQFQYTGGTTGVPKGAMLTHRNMIVNALQCREHLGDLIGDNEVVLGTLPFFHSYGLTVCLNITLLAMKGTLVLLPSFTPKEALHLIQEKKITVFPGVNRMFQTIADYRDVGKYDLSSLKVCVSGAGPLHQTVKEKFEKMTGAVLVEGYGLSEASPVVSVTLPTENRVGSAGRAVPQTEIEIRNAETGEVLGPNEDGVIMIRGPQVMAGYYQKQNETDAVLKDEWLSTGDIGHLSEDGFLYITDREKDMIKVLGENVYPREIEEYLLKNSLIKKCVVVGASDVHKGEAPIVFAVLEQVKTIQDIQFYIATIPNKLWTPREAYAVTEEQFGSWEDVLGKVKRRKIKQYYKETFEKKN
ncbi:MAG: AMP-binding protein [Parcubacteria group bacterium]|nr:AMP-binding protein [Parcubacteria group bacterium]